MKGFLGYILLSPIFLRAFVLRSESLPFDIYYFDFIILASIPIFIINSKIFPKPLFKTFVFIISISAIHFILKSTSLFDIGKQISNIFLYFTYYYYVSIWFSNPYTLFRKLTNILIFCCLIGWIQFFAYFLGVKFLYDYSYIFSDSWFVRTQAGLIRINSIFTEPAFLGYELSLIAPIAINSLTKNNLNIINRWKSILIISTIIITQSAIAYVGILLSIIFVLKNKINLKKAGIFIPILLFSLYMGIKSDAINMRVTDTIFALSTVDERSLQRVNTSTFSLINNLNVAFENFKSNPLFGNGFGSHKIMFDKVSFSHHASEGANREGANSMFLRLFSEFGLLGILLIFVFIKRYRAVSFENQFLYLINTGALVYLILVLIRMGTFGFQSFPLALIIYYLTGSEKK